ncbi:MAG: hypothetical protein ISS43_03120 [Candidatus Omnitrophica bacterium]|nr:hypothetical protein [Candidatus Omnitrophota bacterium]
MVKVLSNLVIMILLSLVLSLNQAQAEHPRRNLSTTGELTLRGRIVQLNEDYRFTVINLGSIDGVKKGMIFSVFQKDEEAAKIKVNKVRRHISACDIQLVYTGRGIGVGDLVIYKESAPIIKMLKPLESTRMIEVEPIVVDIDAPKYTILKKALTVFKEFGTIVTELDSKEYTLKAQKNLDLPLSVGVITEWGPYVRDKVYYTAEVVATPRYNRLIIRLRGVYLKESQFYNHEIKKTSRTYKETQEIAFTIKDLSEKI